MVVKKESAKLSLRKFSYGFAILKFFTIFLVVVFFSALAVRFKLVNLNGALLIVFFSLLVAYFMLPKFAEGIYRSFDLN
ncbi:MAG: hypothetical protein QXU92_02225 [Candidatus Diapherotrites archaeon]